MPNGNQFKEVRRRITHLEHEVWTLTGALEHISGSDKLAEIQTMTMSRNNAEAELDQLNFLLEYYRTCEMRRRPVLLRGTTVAEIAILIIVLFVLLMLAAAVLAGTFHVG